MRRRDLRLTTIARDPAPLDAAPAERRLAQLDARPDKLTMRWRRRSDEPRFPDGDATDDLRSARGVLVGALLGMAIWAGVIYLVQLIVR